MNNNFFDIYIEEIKNKFLSIDQKQLLEVRDLILEIKRNNTKISIVGNGGSASIASHVSVDLTKTAGIRSTTFNEPNLITCFSNDYGYENWVAKSIENYCLKGDLVILISSSGESLNLINAAKKTKELGLKLITLTGFNKNNSLSQIGDKNLWIDSNSYNIVENVHQILLLSVLDKIIIDQ